MYLDKVERKKQALERIRHVKKVFTMQIFKYRIEFIQGMEKEVTRVVEA